MPSRKLLVLTIAVIALLVAGAGLSFHFLGLGSQPAKAGGPPPPASANNGPVAGETYLWRPVAIGGGGFISGISMDDRGTTRVARTDVHGAYIWQPARNRWELLVTASSMPEADRKQWGMNEGVYEIVVAPSDPNRIYMAVKGGLYRSTDRGAHWQRVTNDPPFPVAFDPNSQFRFYGPFIAVDPLDPDMLLFSTPLNGTWRSANGGGSWQAVADLPYSGDMRPDYGVQAPGASLWFERGVGNKPTGRILAAVPNQGVYVSQDRGQHFVPLTSPGISAPMTIKQGSFGPDGSFFAADIEGRKLWRYRRGVWTDLTETTELEPRAYAAVSVNPKDGTIYLFDEGGRTLRSTTNGDSWWNIPRSSKVGEGDPAWLRIANEGYFATGAVMFDPVAADRLWIAGGTGVFVADASSSTLLLTFVSQTRGIEEMVANDVTQPPGQSPLFAALDFGIHVKEDLNRFSSTFGPRERMIIAAQQLAWSRADPKLLVTNASDTRTQCCSEDGQSVLAGYSEDGGRSWTRFASLPTPPGTKAEDPWKMSFGMIAVAANDSANIVWAPSFNRSPFYTKDRGKSWSRVVLPGETLPDTGTHGSLWLARKVLAADGALPNTFYLAHSGNDTNPQLQGLWRTTNGGERWEKIFSGEIAPSSGFAAKLRAVPGKAGHLFFTAAVGSEGDGRLRRSVDGGAHWTVLDHIEHVDDVAFGKAAAGSDYPTIFLSGRVHGQYGIWRSVDDAKSWQQLAEFPLRRLDQVTVMGADPDVFGRLYLGYLGSGWLYGEPAPCKAELGKVDAERECVSVK